MCLSWNSTLLFAVAASLRTLLFAVASSLDALFGTGRSMIFIANPLSGLIESQTSPRSGARGLELFCDSGPLKSKNTVHNG